jgi:hypothetical protein
MNHTGRNSRGTHGRGPVSSVDERCSLRRNRDRVVKKTPEQTAVLRAEIEATPCEDRVLVAGRNARVRKLYRDPRDRSPVRRAPSLGLLLLGLRQFGELDHLEGGEMPTLSVLGLDRKSLLIRRDELIQCAGGARKLLELFCDPNDRSRRPWPVLQYGLQRPIVRCRSQEYEGLRFATGPDQRAYLVRRPRTRSRSTRGSRPPNDRCSGPTAATWNVADLPQGIAPKRWLGSRSCAHYRPESPRAANLGSRSGMGDRGTLSATCSTPALLTLRVWTPLLRLELPST